jgi:hypothetical protein
MSTSSKRKKKKEKTAEINEEMKGNESISNGRQWSTAPSNLVGLLHIE